LGLGRGSLRALDLPRRLLAQETGHKSAYVEG